MHKHAHIHSMHTYIARINSWHAYMTRITTNRNEFLDEIPLQHHVDDALQQVAAQRDSFELANFHDFALETRVVQFLSESKSKRC